MNYYIKIVIIYIIRILFHIFSFLPVKKNRILFSSFEGKNYGCSPKYIFEFIYENYGDSCEYVWCINNKNKILENYKIILCDYLSFRHLFYLLTSRVIITNMVIEPFFIKRKTQLVINTWHGGGAYKKGHENSPYISNARRIYMDCLRKMRQGQTDHVISSCRAFSETHFKVLNVPIDKFLSIGMPRNDLFFSSRQRVLKDVICKRLGIDKHNIVVLYAPTFRGLWRKAQSVTSILNPTIVCNTVKKKFGTDAILLYRHHINIAGDNLPLKGIIDVSDYQDMQELLILADIFITDYSSAVWDFSLTGKPGFLFTPDLSIYKTDTDFDTPIELWPYPYALTIEDLCANILKYDEEESSQKIKAHHALLGSFEKGIATSEICKIIKDHMDK